MQAMGVLARNIKGSEPVVTDTAREIYSAPPRAQEQTPLASPNRHAGPSIISAALTVIGRLECAADIQIDGKVEGDISGHVVRIGAGATVKGTVFGEIVELAGSIEGKIEAKTAVLAKTAHMTGDIAYQSLQIEQGACFEGNCRQSPAKAAPKTVVPKFGAAACCADETDTQSETARLN
jgi:cytoskeletal protein CcmA (bactofilin family)